MIKNSHAHFLRWAVWMHSSTNQSGGMPIGYGGTITAKIVQGKGSILPGRPKGSGPVLGETDRVASDIDSFICKQLDKSERKLVKIFYLSRDLSIEAKAQKLRLAERTLYDHLHQVHVKLDRHLQEKSLRDRMGFSR